MKKGQLKFYKIMHIISIIALVIIGLGIVVTLGLWIFHPTFDSVEYYLQLGMLTFDLPSEKLSGGLALSNGAYITGLIQFILIGFLFWNVKTFFKNLRNEQIFIMSNVYALRNVAVFFIIQSVYYHVPEYFILVDHLKLLDFGQANITINLSYESGFLFAGLAILAVAQVFREAIKIKEENELTI